MSTEADLILITREAWECVFALWKRTRTLGALIEPEDFGLRVVDGVVVPHSEEQEWLIWSNEHAAWWGPDCRGYVHDVHRAGRYTLSKALNICKVRGWEREYVPPETMMHVSALSASQEGEEHG